MRTVFACIAYLRDLFPEAYFEDEAVAGMTLKRIRPRASPVTDQFVKWIEEGCFDAMAHKYLRSVVLVISSAPSFSKVNIGKQQKPKALLGEESRAWETYTIRVAYPQSPDHTQWSASLSLDRDDAPLGDINDASTFKAGMTRMLRTLCISTQTLNTLPGTKNNHRT